MFILVTGGCRSGRSNYALRRAAELGPPPWLYVTGGEETDEAIRKRIERHRRDNEAIWRTAAMPAAPAALLTQAQSDGLGSLVLDGFAGWLATRLRSITPAAEPALLAEIEELADRLYRSPVPVLLVTREFGQGLPAPPGTPEERLLRVVSSANQILAAAASGVVMMVSGLPLKVR